MRKENGNRIINDNNIKKMIIKKINENLIKNNLKKPSQIKKENYIKKKINLSLNNNINLNLNNNTFNNIINSKVFDYNNNNSSIFLENNSSLYNYKKTRNIIKYNEKKEKIPSRLKSIETFEIKFNDKNISKTEYKKSQNIKLFFEKNTNDELTKSNNIKNKSFIEETGRKIFLNINNKKEKRKGKTNQNIIYNYNKNINNYYKRKIYTKIFLSKQNTKRNNYSENNSFFNNRNSKQHDNIWNSSTLEYSLMDKTNKYNNSLTIKNNENNFTNNNCNFMSLGNTYIRKGYTLTNRQRHINNTNITKDILQINEKIKNNSINRTLEGSKMKINNPSFIYTKNKINKKRKFGSCKSQDNIHDNGNNYYLLLDNKNNLLYNYYNKNINNIIKIHKWWKDMIFHIYIEKKIIFIQRKYKIYLNNKKIRNNILFFYLKNIDKIKLIQKNWKSYKQNKNNENDKNKNLNYSHDDSFEKNIPKYIPFKLDNFEINNFSESLIATTKKGKEYNDKNIYNENNIYIKKNIYKRNNKIKKNNTVSHFYISKYGTISSYDNNNYIIEKQTTNFIIKSKNKPIKEITNIYLKFNENKIILVKNISFDINRYSINNIHNENIIHLPINSKCFIEKKYKSKIYKKSNKFDKNYFLTKIRKNKYYIIKNVILIQNKFKKYTNNKKIYKIKKPKLQFCYITKIKKNINKLDNSNHNHSDDIFSFNGSYFKEKINKDRINEKEIINLKKERNNLAKNLNLFSFEDNNQIINNKEYNLTNNQKLKKIFKNYFIYIIISNLRYINNKNIIIIKFINIIKRITIIHLKKLSFELLKIFSLNNKQKKNNNENILEHDEIDNKLNNIKYIKNKSSLISLIENKKLENNTDIDINIGINNNEELANYIYNYFYNEKKFTNISKKLIKERLLKSPLIYNTQNDILNYMHNLYMDIISNKICNIRYCKYGEKYNDNCVCHINNNNQKLQNKNGISIYRQKMNKIINDMNKRRLNNIKIKDNNKININVIKNNDEYNNKDNLEDKYNFKIVNYIKKINIENDKNFNNNIFNRYETDSVHSRSRSKSK